MGMKDNHNLVTKRYVYHLIDPRNKEVFYVGQTVNPGQRLQEHVKGKDSGKSRSARMNEILSSGSYPVMKTVTAVTGTYKEACLVEMQEIAKFARGQLTNSWVAR